MENVGETQAVVLEQPNLDDPSARNLKDLCEAREPCLRSETPGAGEVHDGDDGSVRCHAAIMPARCSR